MAFEIVLPPDTQNEVDEFIARRCSSRDQESAVVGALDEELGKLAANPTLGAVPIGTPFETRRIHRFTILVGDTVRTVEFIYSVRKEAERLVISGFREVPPNAL